MASDQDVTLPDIIADELDQCSDQQLQAIIRYAQQRLRERHDPTEEIKPRHEDETIVSVEDKAGYTLVIVEDEESKRQTAYHVAYETDPDSGEGEYHWRYLGPVSP